MGQAMSSNLWVTYAWADNEDNDIDYIVNRLSDSGINTRFDRCALVPGQRLWEQIGDQIADSSQVGAFAFIVTPNSLASEPCKEELAYAIQRVMDRRGDRFPLIGLMHRVQAEDLPPVLKVRLCISLSSPNWVDQVIAGINKQAPPYRPENVLPYIVRIHDIRGRYLIQITPRVEHLSPVMVVVDLDQQQNGNVQDAFQAPASSVPGADGLMSRQKRNGRTGTSKLTDGTPVFFLAKGR